jgi:hypothetical protein
MKAFEFETVIKKYYRNTKQVEELVARKIDFISGVKVEFPFAGKWQNLIDELRTQQLRVENMSYLQFPNLKLIISEELNFNHIQERKSLVIILSLLCPFYTYYYGYGLSTKVKDGFLKIGEVTYLENQMLQNFKPTFNNTRFKKLIEFNFTDYQYVNHYFLMINKFECGIPYNFNNQITIVRLKI